MTARVKITTWHSLPAAKFGPDRWRGTYGRDRVEFYCTHLHLSENAAKRCARRIARQRNTAIEGMPPKQGARWRKVAKMLATMLAQGVTTDYAKTFGAEQWEIVAKAAGVNAPSRATVRLILSTLRAALEQRDLRDAELRKK